MNKPIASATSTPTTTIAGLPPPAGVILHIDPLGGGRFVLLAVTCADGARVEVRLFVPEAERGDWRRVVRMMRGDR